MPHIYIAINGTPVPGEQVEHPDDRLDDDVFLVAAEPVVDRLHPYMVHDDAPMPLLLSSNQKNQPILLNLMPWT